MRERYAFGRLFGCTRIQRMKKHHRLVYTLGAPALPLVLLSRMAGKAFSDRSITRLFLRSIFQLFGLVLAWSLGEFVGYLTNKRPLDLTVARELE